MWKGGGGESGSSRKYNSDGKFHFGSPALQTRRSCRWLERLTLDNIRRGALSTSARSPCFGLFSESGAVTHIGSSGLLGCSNMRQLIGFAGQQFLLISSPLDIIFKDRSFFTRWGGGGGWRAGGIF